MRAQAYVVQHETEHFLTLQHAVLARLGCVLKNSYVCDADNQSVEYTMRRGEKCEACLIQMLYQVALDKFVSEHEIATDDARRDLEAEAMQNAKDAVSSPFENTRRTNPEAAEQYRDIEGNANSWNSEGT